MNGLPSGTITFLFTDIEGSTTLWEQHPDAMRAALARHDTLLRNAIEDAGGAVFKTMGDGFCAAFAFPPDALAAAVGAQVAVGREAWPPSATLRVRIALHTGSAESRDNDYFGPALNRAGRLLSAAHGGQVLLSAAVYELVRDQLPPNVGLRDLGLHRLKDLERPEQIFQVTHADLTNDFPALDTLDAFPNNLPHQLTSFVGREEQIGLVTGLLQKTGLLTLTGAGGSGKTRLALQVAAHVLHEYPGGAWLVELAPLSDPNLVPQTVAQAVGIKEQAGQTITQTLTDTLKKEHVLLVLDNCEHVASVCAPFIAGVLRACPHVRVLVTSRAPLGISGEQTFRVPSLSLPDPKTTGTATIQSLSQFEAVQLFIERARAVKPDFTTTDQNAPSLAQLCCHLDGIPLALELAAARVRSLPVEDINQRLDSRFRLLTGGDRSALPRQQTLRALVDWSHDLLSEPEKVLFSRLSVFTGGWTLSASEAVCGLAPLADWEVFDLLTGLVDKSLVVAEDDEGAARYGMGETLKQYAAEKQDERSETETMQNRHRDWFLALVEEAEPKLRGPDQTSWLRLLEAEHDNLRAALAWCSKAANPANGGAWYELRLAGALWRLWYVRGYFGEGREHLSRALQNAEGAASGDPVADGLARTKVLNGAGNLAYVQGDYSLARSLFEESLAIQRPWQNKGCADALNNLGNVAGIQGDYTRAHSLYEESLTLYRKLSDTRGIADALNNLGNLAFAQGDFGAAQTLLGECLPLYRQLGHKQGIADALNNLGNVAYTVGDEGAARRLYEESLTIQRELGDKKGVANALNNLGHVVTNQRDFAAAQRLYEESFVLYRELGNKNGIAHSLEGLAGAVLSGASQQKAVLLWGAAHALRESLGAPLPSGEQSKQNEQLAQARAALGEAAFATAWETGRVFSVEQAAQIALT